MCIVLAENLSSRRSGSDWDCAPSISHQGRSSQGRDCSTVQHERNEIVSRATPSTGIAAQVSTVSAGPLTMTAMIVCGLSYNIARPRLSSHQKGPVTKRTTKRMSNVFNKDRRPHGPSVFPTYIRGMLMRNTPTLPTFKLPPNRPETFPVPFIRVHRRT